MTRRAGPGVAESGGEAVEESTATLREFDALRDAGREFLGTLGPGQWAWKPGRDRWSIGDCVAHVNATNEAYLGAIDVAVARGRERGLFGSGPFRHGFLGEFMIREMEPPPRRRFHAPRRFTPPAGETGPEAHREFDTLNARLQDALRGAEGLDLGRVHVVSPANRFLRLSLGQAFRLLAAHARRHLWQARRVSLEPTFPRTPPRVA